MFPCMLLEFPDLQFPKVLHPGFLSHSDRILASSFLLRWSLAIYSRLTIKVNFKILRGKVFSQKYIVMKNLTNFCETVELVWICTRWFSSTAVSYFLLWYRHNRSSLSTLNVVEMYLIINETKYKSNFGESQFFRQSTFQMLWKFREIMNNNLIWASPLIIKMVFFIKEKVSVYKANYILFILSHFIFQRITFWHSLLFQKTSPQ